MIGNYLAGSEPQAIWFTGTYNDEPVALGYCVPEKLTEGTYNLLAIGVKQDFQSHGIGKKMMHFIENILVENQKRILIVETSSDESFSKTRNFYENLGYMKEATIRDFWKEGEAKVVYWKKLF